MSVIVEESSSDSDSSSVTSNILLPLPVLVGSSGLTTPEASMEENAGPRAPAAAAEMADIF